MSSTRPAGGFGTPINACISASHAANRNSLDSSIRSTVDWAAVRPVISSHRGARTETSRNRAGSRQGPRSGAYFSVSISGDSPRNVYRFARSSVHSVNGPQLSLEPEPVRPRNPNFSANERGRVRTTIKIAQKPICPFHVSSHGVALRCNPNPQKALTQFGCGWVDSSKVDSIPVERIAQGLAPLL